MSVRYVAPGGIASEQLALEKGPEVAEGVVASFVKNDRELVVGELNTWKGTRYAHVRVLVPSAVDVEWIHTDNGVAVEADRIDELKIAVDKLLEVASRDVVVGRIPVGKDEIRVGVNTFKGNAYAYLRRFYTKGDEWRPTRKGVSVRIEMAGELVALVGELAAAVRSED